MTTQKRNHAKAQRRKGTERGTHPSRVRRAIKKRAGRKIWGRKMKTGLTPQMNKDAHRWRGQSCRPSVIRGRSNSTAEFAKKRRETLRLGVSRRPLRFIVR